MNFPEEKNGYTRAQTQAQLSPQPVCLYYLSWLMAKKTRQRRGGDRKGCAEAERKINDPRVTLNIIMENVTHLSQSW